VNSPKKIGPRPAPGRPRFAKRVVGFTLIEVLVAFVLLALVLGTAFEIFSTGFARAGELENQSKALVVAQSRLAATGIEEAIKEGDAQGESEDRRFHWTVSVRKVDDGSDPTAPAASVYAMFRIDVRVNWTGADTRERSIALATVTLGPRQ
jgi:general secretion pathway protein I